MKKAAELNQSGPLREKERFQTSREEQGVYISLSFLLIIKGVPERSLSVLV